jgi:hypothetical protein
LFGGHSLSSNCSTNRRQYGEFAEIWILNSHLCGISLIVGE